MTRLGAGQTSGVAWVVVACALVLSALVPPSPTSAAWADTERSTGSLTAGTVSRVVTMTCAVTTNRVTFSWTAPTGGLTRASYRWTLTGGLTGSGTLGATATTVNINGSLLIGTGTFSLYAVGPGGWESVAKTGTATFVTGLLPSCSVT